MAKKNNTGATPKPAGTGTENNNQTVAAALEKIGRETLNINPELTAVFITSDGTAFATESDAVNHGNTLTDKNVVTVEKEKANE